MLLHEGWAFELFLFRFVSDTQRISASWCVLITSISILAFGDQAFALNVTLLALAMVVIELRVGEELKIMHESQNGSQMMANELASLLVQKETKSSLFIQQDDEVFQVVERASAEAVLDSESTRYVEEFAASEIHVKEAGDADHFETNSSILAARKLCCSEEASVDVHSEDSGNDFSKSVSIVEHASEGLAVETKPSLIRKWSREVSVDVIIQDGWPEVEVQAEAEAEVSVAETEVPTSGAVDIEAVDSCPTTEHEAPSTADLEELVSKSLSKDAVLAATEDENEDFRPCPSPLVDGEADEPTQVETINVAESPDEDKIVTNIQHAKSPARALSFADWECAVEADAEESTSAPPQSEAIREQPRTLWSLKNLKERPLVVPRSEPAVRVVKSKAPTVVGLPWPPAPLTSADDKLPVESASSPSEKGLQTVKLIAPKVVGLSWPPAPLAEESTNCIREQRIWRLETLKKRPLVAPRSAVSDPAVRPVKPKAPTVVGLAWPPAPLTSADDKPTELLESASSPSEAITEKRPVDEARSAACEQAARAVKPKAPTVVGLSWPPTPLISTDTEVIESAPSKEQHLQMLRSLKEEGPSVEPRTTVSEQAVRPVKAKAPTLVGLSWPPTPLRVESASSPSEESLKEQYLQGLWRLQYLDTRAAAVEPRTSQHSSSEGCGAVLTTSAFYTRCVDVACSFT